MSDDKTTAITLRPIDDDAKHGEEIIVWGKMIGWRVVFYDAEQEMYPWVDPEGSTKYTLNAFTHYSPLGAPHA